VKVFSLFCQKKHQQNGDFAILLMFCEGFFSTLPEKTSAKQRFRDFADVL